MIFFIVCLLILSSFVKKVILPNSIQLQRIPVINMHLNEKQDLVNRITIMKAEKTKCYEYWNQGETCYITNRLLTKKEVELEIAEMKLRIRQIY